ncbi:hypothetical protein D3C84_1016160 [compost metagenome]
MPDTSATTFSATSTITTSPTLRLRMSPSVTLVCARVATSSTSAACTWYCIRLTQRLSTSVRSACMLLASRSRSGSIIEYGRQTWKSPPPAPSSIWKVAATTTSVGVAMLANWVFISERR